MKLITEMPHDSTFTLIPAQLPLSHWLDEPKYVNETTIEYTAATFLPPHSFTGLLKGSEFNYVLFKLFKILLNLCIVKKRIC